MIVTKYDIKQDKTLNFSLDLNASSGLALKHEIIRSITTEVDLLLSKLIQFSHNNNYDHSSVKKKIMTIRSDMYG
jgi:Ni,Fe-hydrogenase III large subunit